LIHCNENPNVPSDVYLDISFPSGELVNVLIILKGWNKYKAICKNNFIRTLKNI
jgi:hypothetical protein